MFNHRAKTAQRIAPLLRRVLILDPQPTSARALGELLREVCLPEIWAAPSSAKALKLADKVDPQLIFCALTDAGADALAFTRALRRSDLACRKAPVVLVGDASPAAILAGRDAGAHEFVKAPFAARDLLRRLEAVFLHPRGWVEAVDYVGPDRRRFNSAGYDGPLQRLADVAPPHGVRIGEALKIVGSALAAIDGEPAQALRALLAQTAELAVVAAEANDARLAQATAALHEHLLEVAGRSGRLNAAEARAHATPLLLYAERGARAA